MISLARYLQKFRNDENGSVAIELVLVTPIIAWALLSTLVYFDAYRVEADTNRASLVIAEMFSREETNISPAYLNGARNVLRALTYEEAAPDYRITVYRRTNDGRYLSVWSRPRGYDRRLDNADLAQLADKDLLPKMNTIDRNILIETRVEYDAPFSIGLGPFTGTDLNDLTFETFTVIRPRDGRLCFETNAGNVRC